MNLRAIKINDSESLRLAENLRTLFKTRKLTENEVAQDLDIPVMTVRRLLSGETANPKISTLKLIADYLGVTIDALMGDNNGASVDLAGKSKPRFVPILDWGTAERIGSTKELSLSAWSEWQPISLSKEQAISEDSFALESRPSMYPRFPQGTIFIIDPEISPMDGDIILVRIKKNNELTLRELVVDPPEWQLHSIIPGSAVIQYSNDEYTIEGVVVLTMLYNRKAYS